MIENQAAREKQNHVILLLVYYLSISIAIHGGALNRGIKQAENITSVHAADLSRKGKKEKKTGKKQTKLNIAKQLCNLKALSMWCDIGIIVHQASLKYVRVVTYDRSFISSSKLIIKCTCMIACKANNYYRLNSLLILTIVSIYPPQD